MHWKDGDLRNVFKDTEIVENLCKIRTQNGIIGWTRSTDNPKAQLWGIISLFQDVYETRILWRDVIWQPVVLSLLTNINIHHPELWSMQVFWQFVKESKKDTNILEQSQPRATKMVKVLENLTYEGRLERAQSQVRSTNVYEYTWGCKKATVPRQEPVSTSWNVENSILTKQYKVSQNC